MTGSHFAFTPTEIATVLSGLQSLTVDHGVGKPRQPARRRAMSGGGRTRRYILVRLDGVFTRARLGATMPDENHLPKNPSIRLTASD